MDEDIKARVVHYAEQLGRLAGTVKGKTDGALDHAAVAEHLKNIRDGAAQLLKELTPARRAGKGTSKAQPQAVARDARVAAPGKRHRKPAPSAHGVHHSDQRVSKLKAATMKGRHTGRRG